MNEYSVLINIVYFLECLTLCLLSKNGLAKCLFHTLYLLPTQVRVLISNKNADLLWMKYSHTAHLPQIATVCNFQKKCPIFQQALILLNYVASCFLQILMGINLFKDAQTQNVFVISFLVQLYG